MFRNTIMAAAAAIVLSASVVPAQADAWDNFNNYLAAQPDIPDDFHLTKGEFGNNNVQVVIHAGLELVVAKVKGYTIVYVPEVMYQAALYGPSGNAFNGRTIYATDHCTSLSGVYQLGVPAAGGGCEPFDTLAGHAGEQPVISAEVDAVDRFCEVKVQTINHEHSC